MLDWKALPRPILALAPMADLTDAPFCRIVREVCPETVFPGQDPGPLVIFREMISSAALVRRNPKTLSMAKIDDLERPVVLQLFGSDPAVMAEAAKILESEFQPDGIDINMGCPAKKIVSNFDGSSLMREPEKAAAIVRAVKGSVKLPVSVKTRLGWSRPDEVLDFAKILESSGADLITVHGRTKEQGYSGQADWAMVGRAKQAVSIPLLLNGDVVDADSARRALGISNADGVMIGRGALGNPWVFNAVRGTSYVIPLSERIQTVLRHAQYQVDHFGERGLVELRKHLPFYFKRELKRQYPDLDIVALREKLVRISSLQELEEIFYVISSAAKWSREIS